jgi:peptidoglycan/LPS O-acetylase OafA/YrhL
VRTISAISKGASIGWAVVVVLLAAAAYEAAVALEWISLGSQPGDDPPGQAVVTIAAFLALLTGFVAAGIGQRVWRGRLATLVPVVAAAYMVVQYYTFDSYYLPSRTLFRIQEVPCPCGSTASLSRR